MSTYGGQPAVFFLTATGTNYVLQMTTNLSTGPWVLVFTHIFFRNVLSILILGSSRTTAASHARSFARQALRHRCVQ